MNQRLKFLLWEHRWGRMYKATSMAYYEAIWLRKFFREPSENMLETTVVYCDNQSGICFSENLVFHDCSKHIDIRYHWYGTTGSNQAPSFQDRWAGYWHPYKASWQGQVYLPSERGWELWNDPSMRLSIEYWALGAPGGPQVLFGAMCDNMVSGSSFPCRFAVYKVSGSSFPCRFAVYKVSGSFFPYEYIPQYDIYIYSGGWHIGWVVHLPLWWLTCVYGEWFTFPYDWWHMHRMSGSPSPMAYEQDEWFTFSCGCPDIHPTHVVWYSWEVPLIWPMSWEKRIETIALKMDNLCIVVLPMSRMHGVQQLDRSRSSLIGSTPGYVDRLLSAESGKVLWITLNRSFLLSISIFSKDEMRCRDSTWWLGWHYDGWILTSEITP